MNIVHALLLGGLALGAASVAAGCASGPTVIVADLPDPDDDVRLEHPPANGIVDGTFDLERVTLARRGDDVIVTATFRAPLRRRAETRLAEDHAVASFPMTVDVYLDLLPGAGHVEALPGRRFQVPASEAWDRVLVLSSLDDLVETDLVHAEHLSGRGRDLVGIFPASVLPPSGPLGVLAVVLATSPTGTGRVREVTTGLGDCTVWDDERCTLRGKGPPVLDATSDVLPARPLALTYADGARPKPEASPVVFSRGPLVGVAPVPEGQTSVGQLATILDAAGDPLATAIVVSIVGDTVSLEVVGKEPIEGAAGAVFSRERAPED
ncbi:MAG: hypothetical protein KC635_13010 [Myxococcales bacterium]|nr:hypothetical protein [Myxococcales bacterium]MCB9733438.1 hypothetical protein [Deltaproteobacteria bacterium]